MKNTNTEAIRSRILKLIESEYESDAAFERAVGIPDKTVNNWRRGRSSSFMRMLPHLSEHFRVNIAELMDIPLSGDTSELSEDELHLLALFRKSRHMPQAMRAALAKNLEDTISLYLLAYNEAKKADKRRKTK